MEQNTQNAVQTAKSNAITYMAGGIEVKLTKESVIKYLVNGQSDKVSEQEVMMYMGICKANSLNPFAKECYLIKYGTSPAQMVIATEALSKRAERSGHLKGIKYGVIVQRGNEVLYNKGTFMLPSDVLVGGWATISRDDMEDYETSISLQEYKKEQATWKTMPATMIAKCARAKALREAFPGIATGMIAEEEKSTDPNANPFGRTSRADRVAAMAHKAEKVETIPTEGEVVEDFPVEEPSEEGA